jgi:hypothetical protein
VEEEEKANGDGGFYEPITGSSLSMLAIIERNSKASEPSGTSLSMRAAPYTTLSARLISIDPNASFEFRQIVTFFRSQ